MQWITVATPPFEDIERFEAFVNQEIGRPDGMEARYVGTTADGTLRIVSLWESKAHADRFLTDVLGPALAKVLGPEPQGPSQIVGIEVAHTYVNEPVA